jgi:endonuclease YncB( thermonuclease family)
MNRAVLSALLLSSLFLAAAVPNALAQKSAPVEPGQSFTGQVVEVTDGDTYDVRRSIGGAVTIRLHGVDAPESSQPYGTVATKTARRLAQGKNVRSSTQKVKLPHPPGWGFFVLIFRLGLTGH